MKTLPLKLSLITSLISALLFAPPLLAGSANGAVGKADLVAVEKNLHLMYPKTKFQKVSVTPLPGIYEVVMGKNTAYVEENGRYFIFGHLFDMETQTDLTEDVAQNIAQDMVKIDFASLPLQHAIKTVKGDGKRVVAVFSDPDCPYCKKLEQELAKLNNLTIYTFLYPLDGLHPDAKNKADAIWCAKDKAAAWSRFMLTSKTPAKVPGCEAPTSQIVTLASKLGIGGTPFLVAADSRTMPGAAEADRLDKWLNGGAK
ncbi:MAG: DsbC family protein [Methylophilaceae bacterium]|nr:DsbC family protein [Methylophilaceae bacterium]